MAVSAFIKRVFRHGRTLQASVSKKLHIHISSNRANKFYGFTSGVAWNGELQAIEIKGYLKNKRVGIGGRSGQ